MDAVDGDMRPLAVSRRDQSDVDAGEFAPEASSTFAVHLRGSGRHFMWSMMPAVTGGVAQVAVMGYALRHVSRYEYGSYMVVVAALSLVTAIGGALSVGAIRSGALVDASSAHRDEVAATHSIYRVGAILVVCVGVAASLLAGRLLRGPSVEIRQVALSASVASIGAASVLWSWSARAALAADSQFRCIATVSLVSQCLKIAVLVALVVPLGVAALALAQMLEGVIGALLLRLRAVKRVQWFRGALRGSTRLALRSVRVYSIPVLVLFATSSVITASDSFIIGSIVGASAVALYKAGAAIPNQTIGLLYGGFTGFFPKLTLMEQDSTQEAAAAFLTRLLAWTGAGIFATIAVAGSAITQLLLGRPAGTAAMVAVLFCSAYAVDACYHGMVQVVFARAEHVVFARWSWVELAVNLVLTVVLVKRYSSVGAAIAALVTVVFVDVIAFPIMRRDMWGGRVNVFVLRNGIVPAVVSAALATATALLVRIAVRGALSECCALAGASLVASVGAGLVLMGATDRRRLRLLIGIGD